MCVPVAERDGFPVRLTGALTNRGPRRNWRKFLLTSGSDRRTIRSEMTRPTANASASSPDVQEKGIPSFDLLFRRSVALIFLVRCFQADFYNAVDPDPPT